AAHEGRPLTAMKRILFLTPRQAAFTLVETLVASAAGLLLVAVLASAAFAVQKSIGATHQYVTGVNNENRLVDYVAQDFRRALRVGTISSGTYATARNLSSFSVNETSILAISIPDYYGSNTPDNALSSTFKSTRYPRTSLNTMAAYNSNGVALLNGCVPWAEAATTVNSNSATRFAPAASGNGEIQVRYFRGPRSGSDATVCFFRAEYPAGSNTPNFPERDIAERIVDNTSTTILVVSGYSVGSTPGMRYRIQSSFTPRFRRGNATTVGTEQYVEATLRNPRRD
ncbi:MAG: hypothetical protein ABIZ56_01695, partial [Chthoniobacteraceae bacterium]